MAVGKKITRSPHNDEYWDKLKRQFEACCYENRGAYSEVRQRKRCHIDPIQHEIEDRERRMKAIKLALQGTDNDL